MDAEELIGRYAGGERDFRGVNLRDAKLKGANLCGVTGILRANVNEELAIQQLQSEGVIFVSTTLPDGRIYTGHSPTV